MNEKEMQEIAEKVLGGSGYPDETCVIIKALKLADTHHRKVVEGIKEKNKNGFCQSCLDTAKDVDEYEKQISRLKADKLYLIDRLNRLKIYSKPEKSMRAMVKWVDILELFPELKKED